MINLSATDQREVERLVSVALAMHRKDILPHGFDPDRLRVYALIHIAAENDCLSARISAEHAKGSRCQLAGELFGLGDGYSDEEGAQCTYMRGRESLNNVHESARSAAKSLRRLLRIFEKNYLALPLHVRPFGPKVTALLAEVEQLWRWTNPGEDYFKRSDPDQHSSNILTLIGWQCLVKDYSNKQKDMHRLARYWIVSMIEDPSVFRRYIRTLCSTHVNELDTGGLAIDGAGSEIMRLLAIL
jgi:hypothetical protein